MAVTIDGTTGVSAVQAGAVTTSDLPAGTVLQVVYAHTGAAFVLTTTTLVDIVSATITPTSATNKILVFATVAAVGKSSVNAEGFYLLDRNGTSIVNPFDGITPYDGGSGTASAGSVSCEWLDSPASISALTYKIRVRDDSSGGVRINWEGGLTSITLMEIAA